MKYYIVLGKIVILPVFSGFVFCSRLSECFNGGKEVGGGGWRVGAHTGKQAYDLKTYNQTK